MNQIMNMTTELFISQYKTLPEQIQFELANYMEFLMQKYNIKRSPNTGKQIKLSERFYGCIPQEDSDKIQLELTKLRNEWERDIY